MILIDIEAQLYTFFLSTVLGLIFCLFYDILRILHKFYIKGFLEVFILDLLYWIVCAVVTFCFLIIRCSGIIRGFVIFGIILGFIVTRFTLSRCFMFVFSKLFKIIFAILHFVNCKITTILVSIAKYFKNYALNVKKVLQKLIKLMYNQLKTKGKNHSKGV